MTIGEQIKAARIAKGWTSQHILAVHAGLASGVIQRAEAGKHVRSDSLQAIAKALDITLTIGP